MRKSTTFDYIEPLAVKVRIAAKMMGCGPVKIYQLIEAGELESYNDGRSRMISLASIRARYERLLVADRDKRLQKWDNLPDGGNIQGQEESGWWERWPALARAYGWGGKDA